MNKHFIFLLLTMSLIACDSKEITHESSVPIENNHNVLAEHLDAINSMRKPAIIIQHQKQKSLNKIGGLPWVDDSFIWPHWQGKAMTFLLQINLEDLPSENSFNSLPKHGLLSFFYDSEQSTWGFDPKDRGSWKIFHSKTLDNLLPAKTPQNHDVLHEAYVGFKTELSYPDILDEQLDAFNFNDEQRDAYYELRDTVFNNQSRHQLFGHVAAIQNPEMDLKSQLTSNGIYLGDSSGYNSDKAKALMANRNEWRLLLQFDTDEELGIMWADSGTLYFWMKQDDIKNRNFDNAWMILQSY